MIIRTAKLSGKGLRWATAKALWIDANGSDHEISPAAFYQERWNPIENWAQAGQIIDREGITCGPWTTSPAMAHYGVNDYVNSSNPRSVGPTKLIAAMRCFVTRKLGDEVEIPNEFLDKEMT